MASTLQTGPSISEPSSSSNASSTAVGGSSTFVLPTRPPKSKTQPYYSVSSEWNDIVPIPLVDLQDLSTYTSIGNDDVKGEAETLANAGPALAVIAYTPRYAEAMSYLRAVMAADEYSVRALALTEDIIGMNPAHYTVWIYRYQILRHLWEGDANTAATTTDGEGNESKEISEKVLSGVDRELKWLEGISETNLKNYQIWHHRTSLVSLLPTMPKNEPEFLAQILSLDTKNYHVWSYRQWLCTRFPTPLLTTNSELDAMDIMVREDPLNNSAWNHRWFVVFGWKELEDVGLGNLKDHRDSDNTSSSSTKKIIDLEIVEREIEYTQNMIRTAPQNGSSWNYLKGILKYSSTPITELKTFCSEFVGEEFDFYQQATQSKKGVRSSQAIEMLIDIFDLEGGESNRKKVKEGLAALSELWDPIRKRYWEYRLGRLLEKWKMQDGEIEMK